MEQTIKVSYNIIHNKKGAKNRIINLWWYDNGKRKRKSITTDYHARATINDKQKRRLRLSLNSTSVN